MLIEKELFAPTENGILVSSPYVSSMSVVPRSGLNDQSRHIQIKRRKSKKPDKSDADA